MMTFIPKGHPVDTKKMQLLMDTYRLKNRWEDGKMMNFVDACKKLGLPNSTRYDVMELGRATKSTIEKIEQFFGENVQSRKKK
jgi:hypothetical protein